VAFIPKKENYHPYLQISWRLISQLRQKGIPNQANVCIMKLNHQTGNTYRSRTWHIARRSGCINPKGNVKVNGFREPDKTSA
jgi:hypothetical protein